MSLEFLNDKQRDLVAQFESISGLDLGDESDNIIKLMQIFEWDLNNAVSEYFDNKFNAVEARASRMLGNQQGGASSGYEMVENEGDIHMAHRHVGGSSHHNDDNVINLQNQFLLDSFLTKLPKAPKIRNNWQLEVGLRCSLKDEDRAIERGKESTKLKRHPVNSLWLILLLVPKSIFQFILSIFGFLFAPSKERSDFNRLPRTFDYDKYDETYRFLTQLARQLRDQDNGIEEKSKGEEFKKEVKEWEEKYSDDVVVRTDNIDERVESLLDDFQVYDKDFNAVHAEAQSDYKWILVLLINDDYQTANFLKTLLKNPEFHKLFNKNDGVYKETSLYLSNVETDPEAFEIAVTYRVKRLPYVMLIGNVSNSPAVMSSMSILYKSNISLTFISNETCAGTTKKVLKNVEKLAENFNPQLITQRFDKQEIEISRILKQQQDDAYIQSLEKDRIKKAQKEQEQEMRQEFENKAKFRDEFLSSLIKFNWFEDLNATDDSKSKISIKLPDGKRIIEVILRSLTLNDLYLFVELKLYINELVTSPNNDFANEDDVLTYTASQPLEKPLTSNLDYIATYPFKFELIQPFPKKVFAPNNDSLASIPELVRGANLLVEYLLDEDEEDEDDEHDESDQCGDI